MKKMKPLVFAFMAVAMLLIVVFVCIALNTASIRNQRLSLAALRKTQETQAKDLAETVALSGQIVGILENMTDH